MYLYLILCGFSIMWAVSLSFSLFQSFRGLSSMMSRFFGISPSPLVVQIKLSKSSRGHPFNIRFCPKFRLSVLKVSCIKVHVGGKSLHLRSFWERSFICTFYKRTRGNSKKSCHYTWKAPINLFKWSPLTSFLILKSK